MLSQLARRSLVWARIHRVALPGVCTTGLCCKEKGEEGTGGAVCPWLVGPGQGSGRAVVKAGCEQQPQEPRVWCRRLCDLAGCEWFCIRERCCLVEI